MDQMVCEPSQHAVDGCKPPIDPPIQSFVDTDETKDDSREAAITFAAEDSSKISPSELQNVEEPSSTHQLLNNDLCATSINQNDTKENVHEESDADDDLDDDEAFSSAESFPSPVLFGSPYNDLGCDVNDESNHSLDHEHLSLDDVLESKNRTNDDNGDNKSSADSSKNSGLTDEQKRQKRKEKLKKRKAMFNDEDSKEKKTKNNLRKNIREIMEDENLDIGTREAQQKELERVKRVQEAQQRALLEAQKREENQIRELIEKSNEISDSLKPERSRADKDDVICLDSSEENDEDASADKDIIVSKTKIVGGPKLIKKSSDVIDVSSEEENSDLLSSKTFNLLGSSNNAIKDDKDEEDEDDGEDDPENSGCHTNDNLNQPDEFGRVMVNVGHPEDEDDIFIAPQLSGIIKPHQIGGIRFLYENIIESVKGYDKSCGFGCILAHSMGLGKTLQVITFCDIFLRHTSATKVIIVAPINTIQNWVAEFDMWIPPDTSMACHPDFRPRNFTVFTLLDNLHKTIPARHGLTKTWSTKGGVLLMGYEMYRLLTIKNLRKLQAKRGRRKMDEVVDIEEEDRNKELLTQIYSHLCDPGPDLIVCDEGHRIKNNQAGVSQALKNVKTKRRVVLTGYPLQNNLLEYWCMVDFSRPNYLGSKAEFSNMFERPIMNGQCCDSTDNDKRLMKYRSHVLHSLLMGFVQRRSHSVLKYSLPVKEEHVLMVRLTPLQRSLYSKFMEELKCRKSIANPLKAFAVCIKICNHLDILYRLLRNKKLYENDLDLDESSAGGASKKRRGPKNMKATNNMNMMNNMQMPNHMNMAANNYNMNNGMNMHPNMHQHPNLHVNNEYGMMHNHMNDISVVPKPHDVLTPVPPPPQEVPITQYPPKDKQEPLGYDWAMESMKDYMPGQITNGCKMVVLFAIIEHTLKCGERLLVFSQSLYTLDLIEEFLQKSCIPPRPNAIDAPGERWMKNNSYYRLDGSTSAQEREKLINTFNRSEKVGIFILSTRAGCLGINLIGANRVVVYDASWNPCHDAQAVCRVYRYGQQKPIHVYRLVTDNTLEKKIYERQVRKRGMSDRVVDELNPEAKFTINEMSTLLNTDDDEPPPQDLQPFAKDFTDYVLKTLCTSFSNDLSQKPFEHESLLLSRTEEKLTKYEKKLAKQSYEFEKRYSSFNKSAYTTVYTTQGGTTVLSGTPARIYNNVRFSQPMNILNQHTPVQSTPLPMRPFQANSTAPGGAAAEFTKQGVTVQRITINKELSITASKPGVPPIVIPSGKQVLVLRTSKGVYLRTPEGKVISVKLPQNKQGGATNAAGNIGAAGASASGQTVPGGSKEVIDISDDDEVHSSGNQSFGFASNKSMYNVNSVMHTSGGAVLQKKAINNMQQPNSAAMWKNAVQLPQNKATTAAVVTKAQIKDLNRSGVSILPSAPSSVTSTLKGLKEVSCTPVRPKMKTIPVCKSMPLPNNITISKVMSGNNGDNSSVAGIQPNSCNSLPVPTFSGALPQHENANVPLQEQILPVEKNKMAAMPGDVPEGSAFSDLSNFVNKSNLLNDKQQNFMSSPQLPNYTKPDDNALKDASQFGIAGSNNMSSIPLNATIPNANSGPMATLPPHSSSSLTPADQKMPNLFDAGLNVESIMPSSTANYMSNYNTNSALNPFDTPPKYTFPTTDGSTLSASTSTAVTSADSSMQQKPMNTPYDVIDVNKPYSNMYPNNSTSYNSNYYQAPTTQQPDSNFFYNNYPQHQQPSSSSWDSLPNYSSQPVMPSLPVPMYPQSNAPNYNQSATSSNPYSFLSGSQQSSDYLGYNNYYSQQGMGSSSHYPSPYYSSQMGLPSSEQFSNSMYPHHSFGVAPQQQQQQPMASGQQTASDSNMFQPTSSSSASSYNMAQT